MVNFSARCITKFMANVSLVLSDPIAISTCCVNFSARCTKFMANVSLVLSDPIAISTCCVNFSARCTKFMANVSQVLRDHVASTLVLDVQKLWLM